MNEYEQISQIINEQRAKLVEEGVGKTMVSVLGITMTLPASGVPYILYRAIRSTADDATRRCGVLSINTSARQACMMQFKVTGYENTVKLAKEVGNKRLEKKAMKKLKSATMKLRKLEMSLAKHGKVVRKSGSGMTL
jgi:hypothetical protein